MKTTEYYFVMRTYSHNDRQQLWKVMSRPMESELTALNEVSYYESISKNPNHKFFVIKRDLNEHWE